MKSPLLIAVQTRLNRDITLTTLSMRKMLPTCYLLFLKVHIQHWIIQITSPLLWRKPAWIVWCSRHWLLFSSLTLLRTNKPTEKIPKISMKPLNWAFGFWITRKPDFKNKTISSMSLLLSKFPDDLPSAQISNTHRSTGTRTHLVMASLLDAYEMPTPY